MKGIYYQTIQSGKKTLQNILKTGEDTPTVMQFYFGEKQWKTMKLFLI